MVLRARAADPTLPGWLVSTSTQRNCLAWDGFIEAGNWMGIWATSLGNGGNRLESSC